MVHLYNGYYFPIKKENKILLLVAMWTKMKAITSSEMNHTEKDMGHYILAHLQKTIMSLYVEGHQGER